MYEIKSFTTKKFILHLHAEVQISTIPELMPLKGVAPLP
jgi:hypothetical protein